MSSDKFTGGHRRETENGAQSRENREAAKKANASPFNKRSSPCNSERQQSHERRGLKALPSRLFATDRYPVSGRINSYSKPEYLLDVVAVLDGTPEFALLQRSPFWQLFQLPIRQCSLSGKLVHQLLCRSLVTAKKHEMWFVFGGQPMRFSLREFAMLTGLNCGQFPSDDVIKAMQTPAPGEHPYWLKLIGSQRSCAIADIVNLLKRDRLLPTEQQMLGSRRLRLALIVIVEGILLCNSSTIKASRDVVEMVKDLNSFMQFPWGRKSFMRTLETIKVGPYIMSPASLVEKLSQSHLAAHGFTLVFQLLMLKSMPLLERYLPDPEDDSNFTNRDVLQLSKLKTYHNSNILETERDENLMVEPILQNGFPIDNSKLTWVDEVHDSAVQYLHKLIGDGHLFRKEDWSGGVATFPLVTQFLPPKTQNTKPLPSKQIKQLVFSTQKDAKVASRHNASLGDASIKKNAGMTSSAEFFAEVDRRISETVAEMSRTFEIEKKLMREEIVQQVLSSIPAEVHCSLPQRNNTNRPFDNMRGVEKLSAELPGILSSINQICLDPQVGSYTPKSPANAAVGMGEAAPSVDAMEFAGTERGASHPMIETQDPIDEGSFQESKSCHGEEAHGHVEEYSSTNGGQLNDEETFAVVAEGNMEEAAEQGGSDKNAEQDLMIGHDTMSHEFILDEPCDDKAQTEENAQKVCKNKDDKEAMEDEVKTDGCGGEARRSKVDNQEDKADADGCGGETRKSKVHNQEDKADADGCGGEARRSKVDNQEDKVDADGCGGEARRSKVDNQEDKADADGCGGEARISEVDNQEEKADADGCGGEDRRSKAEMEDSDFVDQPPDAGNVKTYRRRAKRKFSEGGEGAPPIPIKRTRKLPHRFMHQSSEKSELLPLPNSTQTNPTILAVDAGKRKKFLSKLATNRSKDYYVNGHSVKRSFFQALYILTNHVDTEHMEAMLNLLWRSQGAQLLEGRVAVLDTWFTNILCNDYKSFIKSKRKTPFPWNSVIRSYIRGMVHSRSQNMCWLTNVDTIYAPMHWGKDHWVSLSISLKHGKILILDPLLSYTDDSKIPKIMEPITKMLPAAMKDILNSNDSAYSPPESFVYERLSSVSQNGRTGDCGPLSVKFIELHSQNIPLDGISDKQVDDMRMQFAIDVFEEFVVPL